MNVRVFYKKVSSQIAPRWFVLIIDLVLVLISVVLACMLQFGVSSVLHRISIYLWMLFFSFLCNTLYFSFFKTYVGILRFSSFIDIFRIFIALSFAYGTLAVGNFVWALLSGREMLPIGIVSMAYVLNFVLMIVLRIQVKMIHEILSFDSRRCVNVFIYGSQGVGVNIAKTMRVNCNNFYRVRGFISDDPRWVGKHAMGCRVYRNDSSLFEYLRKKRVHAIIISSDKLSELEMSGMINQLEACNIHIMTLPSFSDCLDDGIIKNVQLEDWLRRAPIQVDIREVASYIEGSRILITGAAGTVGMEIVRQLARCNPYQLILLDQAESPLYNVQLELSDFWKNLDVKVLVADVANTSRLDAIFNEYKPQLVFHAAAYKNISILEDCVIEAVHTNVLGTKNVVDLSIKYSVNQCLLVSTDQTLSPTHVMGYSKRLAEIYLQFASQQVAKEKIITKLVIARFEDVYPCDLSSLMTMPEACGLLLRIGNLSENGHVYSFSTHASTREGVLNYGEIVDATENNTCQIFVCEQISTLIQMANGMDPEDVVTRMRDIISRSIL